MSPAEALNTKPGHGKHVILVVDDEPGIREFLLTYLTNKDFKVLTADCAATALHIWEENRHRVHLLLTDIIMPGLNGKVMAERMTSENPDLKVIFMSGYLPQEIAEETAAHTFFKKPFHPAELLAAIRAALH